VVLPDDAHARPGPVRQNPVAVYGAPASTRAHAGSTSRTRPLAPDASAFQLCAIEAPAGTSIVTASPPTAVAGPLTTRWAHDPAFHRDCSSTPIARPGASGDDGRGAGAFGASAFGAGAAGRDRPNEPVPPSIRRRRMSRASRSIFARSTVVQSSRRMPPVSPESGLSAQYVHDVPVRPSQSRNCRCQRPSALTVSTLRPPNSPTSSGAIPRCAMKPNSFCQRSARIRAWSGRWSHGCGKTPGPYSCGE
jgi:hypothetical protein